MAAPTHPSLSPAEYAATMERREPGLGPGAVDVVPDPVVEVLSPATRQNDLGPKRAQYLAAGVRELGLVDPADRSVTVVEGRAPSA